MSIHRNRILYVGLIVGTIGLGLASRAEGVPVFVRAYLGDALYALMVYLITGTLFPRMRPLSVAFLSILVCSSVELSQLYQADWLTAIRRTRLGGLVLGFGFLWSDLLCYLAGGLAGLGGEWIWMSTPPRAS